MAITTKNSFRNQVREYILEHINYSITELVENFKRETVVQKNVSIQESFIEWLNGLPTETDFAFSNYEQQEIASQWFENCGSQLDNRFTSEWFYYWIYKEVSYLFKKETGNTLQLYVLQ